MTLYQFSALTAATVRRERNRLASLAKAGRATQYQEQDWARFINALEKDL